MPGFIKLQKRAASMNLLEFIKKNGELHKLFSIPYFVFLRKCLRIKQELNLMGFSNAKIQIRNLPVGSDHYYLCFPELLTAYAYQLKRNQKEEMIEVINQNEMKFMEEVDNFIESLANTENNYFYYENCYPFADPSSIEFYAYEDEKNAFNPSTAYLRKVKKVKQAVDEIENESKQIFLTTKQIQDWLKKHKNLYWSLQLDWNFKALHQFQGLYQWIQMLADDLNYINTARLAIEEYLPNKKEWFYKYDRSTNYQFNFEDAFYQVWLRKPFILKQNGSEFYLVGKEFEIIYQFSQLYAKEIKRNQEEL